MALIKCPECGKEISDKAVSCPNCGCPTIDVERIEDTKEEAEKSHEGKDDFSDIYRASKNFKKNHNNHKKASSKSKNGKYAIRFKNGRLICNIIAIIIASLVFIQSILGFMARVVAGIGIGSVVAGISMAIFMMLGGILGLLKLNTDKKSDILMIGIVYHISFLIAFLFKGDFTDLQVYSWFVVVIAVVNMISVKEI